MSAPFSALTSARKYSSANERCCILWLLQISSPILLIFLSFHATFYQLEEHGHKWVVLALEDLNVLISQNRFQGCQIQGCPAYIWSPYLPIDPLWTLYKKWNQTVPNTGLKTCRFTAAPALFSSRTWSIYQKILAVPGWWVPTCFSAAFSSLGDALECKLL